MSARGFARSSTRDLCVRADVHSAAQKGAGSDDDTFRTEASTFNRLDTDHASITCGENQSSDGALYGLQTWVLLEQRTDCAAVEAAVALRAR